ncbi:hypothetical protein R6Q59_013160 [Mikania micrantha]
MKSGNKISQIVRLKQVVQRWRRRIPSGGSLAVYVGVERRRFVIPTRFLNLPVFISLLNKAEEEFGFQTSGGLVLPCDVVLFQNLLNVLEGDERRFGALDFDDFSERFSDLDVDCSSSSCKNSTISDCRHSFTPLLQKTKMIYLYYAIFNGKAVWMAGSKFRAWMSGCTAPYPDGIHFDLPAAPASLVVFFSSIDGFKKVGTHFEVLRFFSGDKRMMCHRGKCSSM